MSTTLPVTGSGSSQTIGVTAAEAAIDAAIAAAVATEAGTRAAADTALDARLDVVEASSATAVQPGDPVSDLAETGSAKIMTSSERTKLAGVDASLAAKADSIAIDQADMGPRLALVAVGGKVPLSLDQNGLLDAAGLAPHLVTSILGAVMTQVDVTGPNLPLIVEGNNVVMWRKADGTLQGIGLSGSTSTAFAPQVTADATPAATDGRTLSKARAKAAAVRAGSGSLVVAGIGDSWMQGVPIPNAIQAWLASTFGDCDKGWIHANTAGHWSGTSLTASGGWTQVDGDVDNAPSFGQGPDGQMLYATGTSDTLTIVTQVATDLKFFTRKYGGTWRYRIDGGSWTTVAEGASDGSLRVTSVTGLSSASHTINIDLTGNGGTVAWCGAHAFRAAAKAQFLKMGNGGLTGYDARLYFAASQAAFTALAPDLVFVFLGTNDYIYAESPPSEYKLALAAIITTLRAACGANVGIVLVAPALSNSTPVSAPLSQFRDAAYQVALAQGVEFLNLYDLIAPYATDASVWTDSRHLNQTGGDVVIRLLNNLLLKV